MMKRMQKQLCSDTLKMGLMKELVRQEIKRKIQADIKVLIAIIEHLRVKKKEQVEAEGGYMKEQFLPIVDESGHIFGDA